VAFHFFSNMTTWPRNSDRLLSDQKPALSFFVVTHEGHRARAEGEGGGPWCFCVYVHGCPSTVCQSEVFWEAGGWQGARQSFLPDPVLLDEPVQCSLEPGDSKQKRSKQLQIKFTLPYPFRPVPGPAPPPCPAQVADHARSPKSGRGIESSGFCADDREEKRKGKRERERDRGGEEARFLCAVFFGCPCARLYVHLPYLLSCAVLVCSAFFFFPSNLSSDAVAQAKDCAV